MARNVNNPKKNPLTLIARERHEQRTKHKWSLQHDDSHTGGELALAAAAYAAPKRVFTKVEYGNGNTLYEVCWPWSLEPKKDSADRIKDLVKAGALIVAEIERLQRAAAEASKNSPGNMKWVRLVKK
jgi:hypothetical protein